MTENNKKEQEMRHSDEKELRIAVPPAQQHDFALSDMYKMMKKIETAVVGDPWDPENEPGVVGRQRQLKMRQDAQEMHLSDHEKRILDIESDGDKKAVRIEQFGIMQKDIDKMKENGNKNTDWLRLAVFEFLKIVVTVGIAVFMAIKTPHQ